MSTGMAEVIAAHMPEYFVEGPELESEIAFCLCGAQVEGAIAAPELHSTHVAEELAKAGYGDVADAWDEGATAGWKQSGEGFNSEYPDGSTGECSVDLSVNPYREAPHGVD